MLGVRHFPAGHPSSIAWRYHATELRARKAPGQRIGGPPRSCGLAAPMMGIGDFEGLLGTLLTDSLGA